MSDGQVVLGASTLLALPIALGIGFDTLSFGADEVAVMPKLRRATKPYGLSLGDRCCLATALVQNSPALTADRVWAGQPTS